MQRCRIIRSVTIYQYAVYLEVASTISRDIDTGMSCLLVETAVCGYHVYKVLWEPRVGEKHSLLCTKLILNRDQLVKYLGFPVPELEIIYPICAKGCRKIRDAKFLEDIRYTYYNVSASRHASALKDQCDCSQLPNLQASLSHVILNMAKTPILYSPEMTPQHSSMMSLKIPNLDEHIRIMYAHSSGE